MLWLVLYLWLLFRDADPSPQTRAPSSVSYGVQKATHGVQAVLQPKHSFNSAVGFTEIC